MTATTDERPVIPDEEIREWGRATGRKVPERGKVGAALRAEYEAAAAGIGASVDAGEPAAPGAQAAASKPKPARAEQRPRPPAKPAGGALGRARAWFNGATTTTTAAGKKVTKPKERPDRPRTPVTRLVERGWGRAARLAEHVNIPVARTMAWQAPYVGIVAEDVIAATPLDKVLQPFARAETAISGVGSMIAMPILVGLITSERNDPNEHGLAAVVRQQLLAEALDECIDAQLEMFGSRDLAAKIVKSAEDQAARGDEIERIRSMIFAQPPPEVVIAEDATEAQVMAAQQEQAQHAAAEQAMRDAAAAVKFMRARADAGPDTRGDAAERAAAQMRGAASAAAAAQASAVRFATDEASPLRFATDGVNPLGG